MALSRYGTKGSLAQMAAAPCSPSTTIRGQCLGLNGLPAPLVSCTCPCIKTCCKPRHISHVNAPRLAWQPTLAANFLTYVMSTHQDLLGSQSLQQTWSHITCAHQQDCLLCQGASVCNGLAVPVDFLNSHPCDGLASKCSKLQLQHLLLYCLKIAKRLAWHSHQTELCVPH